MNAYRVLTPTMYRSRMACARQAVSMDYDDENGAVKRNRLRREGPAIRGPSPGFLRPKSLLKTQRSSGENSFDLELGASATRVHQLPGAPMPGHQAGQQLSAGGATEKSSSSSKSRRTTSPSVQHSLGKHKLPHFRSCRTQFMIEERELHDSRKRLLCFSCSSSTCKPIIISSLFPLNTIMRSKSHTEQRNSRVSP